MAITSYHLMLALFSFIFSIIGTIILKNELGKEYITGYNFLLIVILGIISGCFCATLIFLLRGKDTKENLLKLGFIIPIHCFIGIISSFLLGGHLFFNENQIIVGILIGLMIPVEITYLILLGKFQKKKGITWEKPKSNIALANKKVPEAIKEDTIIVRKIVNPVESKKAKNYDYQNIIYWVMAIALAILFIAVLINDF